MVFLSALIDKGGMAAVIPENSLGSILMSFRSEGGGEQEVYIIVRVIFMMFSIQLLLSRTDMCVTNLLGCRRVLNVFSGGIAQGSSKCF